MSIGFSAQFEISRRPRSLGRVLSAVILPAFLTVLSAQGFAQNAPPPPVSVAKPVVKEIVERDDFIGRFDAVDTVDLRARVSGYLDRVHFADGALVKKGDLLFTIDQRPYRDALDDATGGRGLGPGERSISPSAISIAPTALHQVRQHHRADRRPAPPGGALVARGPGPGQGGPEPGQARHGVHRDPRADLRAASRVGLSRSATSSTPTTRC